mgnify:CR=1 FL=1|tara:strand:+ start:176 stop:490 length:315 start_codon:yes stop_codon:yes gene_type:complete
MPKVAKKSHPNSLKIDSPKKKIAKATRNELGLKRQSSLVNTKNEHLNSMDSDYLYHLGLSKTDSEDFSHVKFVCIGGTNDRMTKFANQVAKTIGLSASDVKSVG